MKQTNTAKRPAIFVTLNDCKLVSCDRQLLSCDRKLISCDRKLVSCDRKLISCDRKLVSCDRKLISCDRKLVSCDRKLVTCDEKNRCVPYEPPYPYLPHIVKTVYFYFIAMVLNFELCKVTIEELLILLKRRSSLK